jgi:hypothetical protein
MDHDVRARGRERRMEFVRVEHIDDDRLDAQGAKILRAICLAGGACDLPAIGYQELAEGFAYGAGGACDEDAALHAAHPRAE